VLDQFLEDHPVEARGRRHDNVRNIGYGRVLLHAPRSLRGRAEPLVEPDAGIGDGAGLEALELRAQRLGSSPDLLAGKVVCSPGGPGTEVVLHLSPVTSRVALAGSSIPPYLPYLSRKLLRWN
jgi:hypothetical protein